MSTEQNEWTHCNRTCTLVRSLERGWGGGFQPCPPLGAAPKRSFKSHIFHLLRLRGIHLIKLFRAFFLFKILKPTSHQSLWFALNLQLPHLCHTFAGERNSPNRKPEYYRVIRKVLIVILTPGNTARSLPPWNTFQKCIWALGPLATRDAASLPYALVFKNKTVLMLRSPSERNT